MHIPAKDRTFKAYKKSLAFILALALIILLPIALEAGNPCEENPCAVNPCGAPATTTGDTIITTTPEEPVWGSIPGVETGLTPPPEEPAVSTDDEGQIYIDTDYIDSDFKLTPGLKWDTGIDDQDWTDVIPKQGTRTREHEPTIVDPPTIEIVDEEDDDGDPRDTPPPVIYGEEDGGRYGILLMRENDRWIPRYGNVTIVRAKLYIPHANRRNVWVPNDVDLVKKIITVKFVERSNEPGKALNRSIKVGDPGETTPDIFLRQDDDLKCYDDTSGKGHYGACDTKVKVNAHWFVVKSEDYGSYSKMDASCDQCVPLTVLHSGTGKEKYWPLGVEEQDPEVRLVRVPKDVNKNQISDGYLPDQGEYMGPDYDDDKNPTGDGTDGDGLGAYEEYRGFFVQNDPAGPHIRTDWHTKDLFVYNPSGLPGTDKFGEVAKTVDVHEIASYEHEERVINFNYKHGHVVDQHGLKLKVGSTSRKGLLGEVTDFGPPKNVDLVKIYLANHYWRRGSDGRVISAEVEDTVVHELGHAVGMRHHGDTATWTEWYHPPGGISEIAGGLLALATAFSPIADSHTVHNRPVLCGMRLPANISFGHKHNQSSGTETCFMRYKYHGDAFKQEDGSIDCLGSPPDGTEFCDTSEGKAFNAGNRTAGSATKGDCASQLIINDNS